jgi:hypothetical protein
VGIDGASIRSFDNSSRERRPGTITFSVPAPSLIAVDRQNTGLFERTFEQVENFPSIF